MNDQPTTPGPDDPMDPDDLAELRAVLAGVDTPSAATRAQHLRRALAEFEAGSDSGTGSERGADVVPLHGGRSGRRFERRTSWLVGAAAAAVVVLGVGLGVFLTQSGGSRGADVASASRGAASTTAEARTPGPQANSAGGAAAPTSVADANSANKSVAEQSLPAAATFAEAQPVNLGSVASDHALRKAMTASSAADSVATTTPSSPEALGRVSAGETRCATQLAALPYPRFTATVAGRPVIAAPATSAGLSTPTAPITVVVLSDCAVRTI